MPASTIVRATNISVDPQKSHDAGIASHSGFILVGFLFERSVYKVSISSAGGSLPASLRF